MKRFILLFYLVYFLPAPVLAGILDDIDRAVENLGDFIIRSIPDESGETIYIIPLLSDKNGRNLLGDRLKSELELYLSGRFRNTRIVTQPEGYNNYTIAGEIQAYPGTIRIILKIINSDGSLGGGTRFDLSWTPELEALLKSPDEAAAEPFRAEEDPFEPDDLAGYEVEVEESTITTFNRFLDPGDIDRFRFYLPAAGKVILETTTPLDIQMLLYREGENIPILVNDHKTSSGKSSIESELEAGYYVVEVSAFDFNIEGAYALVIDISGRGNDKFEPDNSFEEARSIYPNSKQERILSSGDTDWVELSYSMPGFYTVYTTGSQTDTMLSLFWDQDRELLADDDSGELFNAHLALFLGNRRIYARVSGKELSDTGYYTLCFEQFEPAKIYPNGSVYRFAAQQKPHYLKLRILQSGDYVIRKSGVRYPVILEIYNLPNMMPEQGRAGALYFLSSGDYLIALKSNEAESMELCVAPEGASANCERNIGE